MNFQDKFSTFLLYIYTFYIIYRPNLSPWIGNINLLYVFTLVIYVILFLRHRNKIKRTIKNKHIGILITFLLISLLYLCIFSIIQNGTIYSYGVKVLGIITLIVLPNILFICFEFMNKKYSMNEFITFILNVGLIQSIVTILMFVFPDLRTIAMESYLQSAQNKTEAIFNYRIYGLSSDYTFSMQLFQGFLMGMAIICSIFIDKKYIIYIPFLMISSIVNGRSGVIFCLISIILVFLLIAIRKKSFKSIINIFILSLLFIFLVNLALQVAKYISVDTYEWIMRLYYETNQLLNGNIIGTYEALFNNMLFFPNGMELIGGTGQRVFGSREIGYLSSDVGYVNDIFIGGLLFLIFFYIPILKLLLANYKTNYFHYAISIFCVIFIILSNYKGEIFRPNVLIYGIFLIKIYSIIAFENNKFNKKN